MKIAIMQPYFAPYIGYFQLINSVDTFILYDDVQYIWRGWINRNYILSKEGKQLITIPIQKPGKTDLINNVLLSNENWKASILKSIFYTYKKAPFFENVYPILENVFALNTTYLNDIVIKCIIEICNYIGIKTKLIKSSVLNYNTSLNKIEKVNDIIQLMNATQLILPPGSKDLYNKSDFSIKTEFLKMNNVTYKQFSKIRFEGNLSIIDVLMFNTLDEINKILNSYELI